MIGRVIKIAKLFIICLVILATFSCAIRTLRFQDAAGLPEEQLCTVNIKYKREKGLLKSTFDEILPPSLVIRQIDGVEFGLPFPFNYRKILLRPGTHSITANLGGVGPHLPPIVTFSCEAGDRYELSYTFHAWCCVGYIGGGCAQTCYDIAGLYIEKLEGKNTP